MVIVPAENSFDSPLITGYFKSNRKPFVNRVTNKSVGNLAKRSDTYFQIYLVLSGPPDRTDTCMDELICDPQTFKWERQGSKLTC